MEEISDQDLDKLIVQADKAAKEYIYLVANHSLWAKLGKSERDLKVVAKSINHILNEFEIIAADLGYTQPCKIIVSQDSYLGWDGGVLWHQTGDEPQKFILEAGRPFRVLAARMLRTLAREMRGFEMPGFEMSIVNESLLAEFYADLTFQVPLQSLSVVMQQVSDILKRTFKEQLVTLDVYEADEEEES